MSKNNQRGDKRKRIKKGNKQMAKAVIMAVSAKLGYKKGKFK